MATNLYCVADQCFVTPTAGDKATNLPKATNTNATGAGFLDSSVEGCLTTWYGGSGNVVNRTVNTTGTAVNQSYYFGRFSSLPLAAQTIPAQSWNWAMIVGEGSNSANTFIWPVMYVWRPSNNTVVGYIFDAAAAAGSEIAATPGTATRNFAGAAVTTQDGDLLVVEAWMSGTPTAAVFTQTWRMTDKASAISSPYTILFQPQTSLWVTSATASVAPTAGTKASNLPLAQNASAAAGELVWEIATPPNDTNQLPRTVSTLANTNPQSGFYGRWSTGPLAAQTIPVQNWGWELSGGETNTNAKIFWWPVVYAWRPSTNAVVGYVFNATGPQGVEWYVNADPKHNQIFTGAAVTLQNGDILVLEAWGAGTQTAATSYGPTIWINSFNSKIRSPYVILPQGATPALGDLTRTEADDTISATATVVTPPALATLTQTEAQDTLSSTTSVIPFPVINATLTQTEGADTVDASCSATAGIQPLATLQEDFELPINAAKWDGTNVFNGTVTFVGGVGEFAVTSTVNTTHASLISVENFDLKNSSIYWKIVQPPRWTVDAAGGEFSLAVEAPGDNRIDWTIYSNGDISIIKFTNNAWGQIKAVDTGYYSKQDTYRWLRTREAAGITYFESAPSTASNPPAPGDWVLRHSVATNTLPINAGASNVKAIYRLWVSGTAQGAMIQPGRIDGLNTAASGGTTPALATLTITEAPDTVAATAGATAGATLTRTEAPDTLAATASSPATGNLTRTEAPDTLVATVISSIAASLFSTEAPDTLGATASSPTAANLGVTEAGDVVTSGVSSPATGALTSTEAPDTLSATASVLPFPTINASLNVQEESDRIASSSGSPAAIADFFRTEAPDTLVASVTATIGASLARTEAPDVLSATAAGVAGASLARTEAADSLASSATVPATGNLSKTEADDTSSSIVKLAAAANLSIQEAGDTLASTVTVLAAAIGGLTVTEDPDTVTSTATVANPISTANLSVTEESDTSFMYTVHAKKRVILIT